jgi:hypothetical protein
MLYITTKPFALTAGNYSCKRLSTDDAAALIRKAHSAGELKSVVGFATTAAALRALTSVQIDLAERSEVPFPVNGDRFLDVRLKADTPKGHKIGIADVEFWLIEFKLVDYEQIKESAEWPKVLH